MTVYVTSLNAAAATNQQRAVSAVNSTHGVPVFVSFYNNH